MTTETQKLISYSSLASDNKKVVYLSGPHGAGKSTLIEDLTKIKELDLVIKEQIAHMDTLEDMMSRHVWRIALHVIEHRENIEHAHTTGKSVMGDRSLFDDLAYLSAFAALKWMDATDVASLISHTQSLYKITHTPQPVNTILLMPPISWNIERIEERWKKGERTKWMERDYTYLAYVRDEFDGLVVRMKKEGHRILVIRDIDRNSRIVQVKEWLKNSSIVPGTVYQEGRPGPRSGSP